MTNGKVRPSDGAPGLDRQTEKEIREIISQKNILFQVVFLPRHIFDKLLKIAAFLGIPSQILAESEITKFVLKNWNSTENRPVKENRDDFI